MVKDENSHKRSRVPMARPETIRKALECEKGKQFKARGIDGVKSYGNPSEFESDRDACVRKMEKLLETMG